MRAPLNLSQSVMTSNRTYPRVTLSLEASKREPAPFLACLRVPDPVGK